MRDTRRTMAGKKKARQSPTARRQAGSAKSPKKKPKAAKQAAKRKSQGAKKKNKAAKQAARKTTTSKKTAKKKAASQSARKTAKQKTSPKKRTNRLKSTGRKSRRGHAAPPQGSLGRPKVTGEEKLFLLFKQDYHARQVFSFLGVETVRELEQFEPDQIIKLLSQPIRQAVQQIRAKLAENNRSLHGDKEFALRFQKRKKT